MDRGSISIGQEHQTQVISCNTAIVGSGAAGYNAARQLWKLGQRDIVLLTEDRLAGTSRNTGSDKQTYYKLTVSGGQGDSVREMAGTLYSGQCVDGDVALCEASLSTRCFFQLVELGVPFPRNRYGEYVGYKTDHDPRTRATSAGPYTSRLMTKCLEQAVTEQGVPVLDGLQVIRVLSDGEAVYGLLCLKRNSQDPGDRFRLIHCKNVIYATGGPGGIYADSVYPKSQFGATGLALEAGVRGRNLTEWQFGLSSVQPRWNVSGTYMQVLPQVYSTDPQGNDPREFLLDFFETPAQMLSKLFLKGYQWPFDVRKIRDGSSIIDILVYLETCKGRRVFLDYRRNPTCLSFASLDAEPLEYLRRAGACFGTPLERLAHMNQPAIDFYRDQGVDLAKEPLEIALCAQHNNGGLAVDCWWQTNVAGFFAAGEAAASHGVYRPGGSALNAGQVGSTRSAQYIAARRKGSGDWEKFRGFAAEALEEMSSLAEKAFASREGTHPRRLMEQACRRMSLWGGAIRSADTLQKGLDETETMLRNLPNLVRVEQEADLIWLYRLRDTLICQASYLAAMAQYSQAGGKSRGSGLYTDPQGEKPYAQLPDAFTFTLDDGRWGNWVQELWYADGVRHIAWRPVRPIPEDDDFFENVWRDYRETGCIE